MEKHRVGKAAVLLVVILFHSFVLVSRAHATAWEGTVGRIMFRSLAPAVIGGMSGGMGIVAGVVIGGGVGYIAVKSGAVAALETWWNNTVGNNAANWAPAPGVNCYFSNTNPDAGPTSLGTGIYVNITKQASSPYLWGWNRSYYNNGAHQYTINGGYPYNSFSEAFYGAFGHNPGTANIANFTDTMDYGSYLAISQPSFPANSVYASPGAAAALAGGAAIVSVAQMSDSDIDKFITGTGSTPVSSDGVQEGSPPATNDNTMTAGDTASVGLLQQILNFVSNLVGIKTGVESVRTSVDNAVVGISQNTAKMDNVVVGINQQTAKLDNVVSGINTQTGVLEQVGTKVEHMDNTISGISSSTATVSSLQTRVDALRDLAATKFPFSLVGSLSASAVSGTSHYEFGSLPLTPTISVPIEPMLGPLSSLFTWIRQLLVWFFWAGTLLAMLRKTMEM